ncbi:MAG: hypothetical protein ACOX4O_09345 [Eubacteriales bacterium]|jgi:hypothetical protein
MQNSVFVKLTSIILAILLTSSVLFACGGKGGDTPKQGGTADTQADVETAEETTAPATSVPAGTDFGGTTINVLNSIYFSTDGYYFDVSEETGDVVNDAVYERNMRVQNDVNVSFNVLTKHEDAGPIIEKCVTSGSNEFDFVFGVQFQVVPLVVRGMFMNLEGAPYIDIEKDWWDGEYTRECSIGINKRYFMSGDITLGLIRHQSCCYVNKQMFENLLGDPQSIYTTVLDGKWTLDQFSEYASKCYSDLNGDTKFDEGDQYGCGVITANLTDHFTYDAGVRCTERDENDIPILVMNNERTVSYAEKIRKIYYENEGIRVFPADYTSLHEKIPNKFKADSLAFMVGWFYISDYLRDMEGDYAVIPFPKYDESQESYLALIHDVATLVCVPATCDKLDTIAAILELLAYEGYNTVAPAYYEVALKTKYIRDNQDAAMQIMDIIHDASTSDFAYIYNYALNSIGLIMREVLGSKKGDFVSSYAKKEVKTQALLDDLIEVYTSLD